MTRRKVIRQGKGTLTMSLPMDWVRQLKISAGDEIEVEQRGFQLVIGPGTRQFRKKTEVDVSGLTQHIIVVILQNLYIRGDEEIKIRFDNPQAYDAVAEAVKGLIGFEIVEQTANSCVIKELARGENEDFDTILRRIFLIILNMADDGITAFKAGDKNLLASIMHRDKSTNTLVIYSQRMLNKKGGADVQKSMHLYTLLTLLEHLGDEYHRLYRDVFKISSRTLLLISTVAKFLRKFYELFYKFDKLKACDLKSERDKIREQINKELTVAKNRDDLVALHHLRSIADLIIDIEKFQLAMEF